MKTVFVIIGLLVCSTAFAQIKQEPQKFETRYTVTYNSISLEEAAKLEKRIKSEHMDACVVEVELDEEEGITIVSSNGLLFQ